jgi:excisionase family DNA binding protein
VPTAKAVSVVIPEDNSTSSLRWLTVEQAAAYLQVSPGTIRQLLHAGDIKAARVGPLYRIDRNDLDQFLLRKKQIIPPYRKNSRPWVAKRHAQNRKVA